MPPPQKQSSLPNSCFMVAMSILAALRWMGLRIWTPASMRSGMRSKTDPQECMKTFAWVLLWMKS